MTRKSVVRLDLDKPGHSCSQSESLVIFVIHGHNNLEFELDGVSHYKYLLFSDAIDGIPRDAKNSLA